MFARRMKASGELVDDGASLVAPNTHTNPDMLGERRDEALNLGSAVDELTSGEVSDEEIAKAIMQSMDLPAVPGAVPAGLPPAGMPPSAAVPKGLPPAGLPPASMKTLPTLPLPTPQPMPAPLPAPAPVANQGPPLPPGGLPAGWTMSSGNTTDMSGSTGKADSSRLKGRMLSTRHEQHRIVWPPWCRKGYASPTHHR